MLQAKQGPHPGEVLATAYRLLHERVARIDDDELRRSSLENVPASREIVEHYLSAYR